MDKHTLTYERVEHSDESGGKKSEVIVVTEKMQAPDVWHCILAVWSTQEPRGRREIIKRLDAIAAAIDSGINPQHAHLGPIAYETCIQQHGEGSLLCPK